MQRNNSVFFDLSGRRRILVYQLCGAVSLIVLVGLFALVFAIVRTPILPPLPESIEALNEDLPTVSQIEDSTRLDSTRLDSTKLAAKRLKMVQSMAHLKRSSDSKEPWISAAFYSSAPGREESLRDHADKITHLMPVWLHLNRSGSELDFDGWDPTDTENIEVLKIAKENEMQVLPVLNNAVGSKFDPERVHTLLQSTTLQDALITQIRDWLKAQDLSGLNLDFENLRPEDQQKLPLFVARLAKVLHDSGFVLSLDVSFDEAASTQLAALVAPADFIVLMAYDQDSEATAAGPIASMDWTAKAVANAVKAVPPSKIVLGMGDYGYDWSKDKVVSELTYASAMHTARTHSPTGGAEKLLRFDPDSLNPYFEYQDEASGDEHKVWYLDAASVHNQCLLAKNAGLRGSALWEIGGEDPGIWTVLGDKGAVLDGSVEELEQVDLSNDVQYDGDGELIQVISQPRTGERKVSIESASALITKENYQQVPWGSVVQRNGRHPGVVALTFDDGPNPKFTPQILDILQKEGITATFFLIGDNAAKNPDLVRQLWNAGHEIGNHTYTHPNLSQVGEAREKVELNATQRVIQSILGRSTLLFRAPYFVETEPQVKDLDFISTATDLGYVTVGAGIDPNDWNPYVKNTNGDYVRNSARVIADHVLAQIRSGAGNTVLFHDGGGDRSQTVAALRLIIPQLKQDGYRFVRVSQLADASRETLMPRVGKAEGLLLRMYHYDLLVANWMGRFLDTVVLIAMIIGVFRIIGITSLAIVAHRRNKRRKWPVDYCPAVSVLIPAYNESAVICRSVRSLLESTYTKFEILLIDDGSSDHTASVVEKEFAHINTVRTIRQANRGKAAALNRGIAEASGEIIVTVDADTLFEPDAIAMLVRRFSDPEVGAVAGNIKVGNRKLLLTRMQATEYITSQNLDRLAYSLLGAITLVPGAIGAFRRVALQEVGSYHLDTLAEDFDLTCRIRQAGWTIKAEVEAIAYTEAPEDIPAFLKQRKRWSFGTLQTLWKNRQSLFQYGGYGWLGMPVRIWEFFFYSVAPLLYLKGMATIALALYEWIFVMSIEGSEHHFSNVDSQVVQIAVWFSILFTVELIQSFIAIRMDNEDPRLLRSLLAQRFYFRQIIYLTLWMAWFRAFTGAAPGWGILRRHASVDAGELPHHHIQGRAPASLSDLEKEDAGMFEAAVLGK